MNPDKEVQMKMPETPAMFNSRTTMTTTRAVTAGRSAAVMLLFLAACPSSFAASAALLGWNNLGMHCTDKDFSVFCTLPPYNTIEAQLIVNGSLVTSGTGYSLTYEAIADPTGSINTTSLGKDNFWTFTPSLFGPLPLDVGLLGWAMPGTNNTPQSMRFDSTYSPASGVTTPVNWFRAEGIPITPYDDARQKNYYPLMHLVARDSARNIVATKDIVLPVSDEMACSVCHSSGGSPAARPPAGWVYNPDFERDYRLNILLLHDGLQDPTTYPGILSSNGFNPNGLYASVVVDQHSVLCAKCHLSEALQGSGYGNIPPLTRSIHSLHAFVTDPVTGLTLDNSANRSSCYRCHPGSTTKCLRGAMGSAIASDGSQAMQCQSCHGNLSAVGSANRVGWFMEPACQSCHTGTATHNNGQIRYTSVFTASGAVRVAVDQTFATSANTPTTGLNLYRFSVGHGGLQCTACHGSTHAIFATSHTNDNIYSVQTQGHIGTVVECTACHTTTPTTVTGGPHGMHPVGQAWVSLHPNAAAGNSAACQVCHGTDYRGTVLSLVKGDRTISAFGTQSFFRGAIIGCYTCHNGPGNDSGNTSPPPTVSNVSVTTTVGQSVSFNLPVSGSTSTTLRIISQAAHGAVGLINGVATYFPDAGFAGSDAFTFAAYDGSKNSNLGTGTISVGGGVATPPVITVQPASITVTAGSTASFTVGATGTAPLGYQWQKNGVNLANGGNVSGATTATLALSNVSSTDAAGYRVIVSNTAGSVTSAAATLTVTTVATAPSITQQPVSRTVTAGATVSFTVGATGTAPLSYQWQKNGVNLANGGNVSGATTATLALSNVSSTDAAGYRVIVSNTAGSVTSATATLTVNTSTAFSVALTSPVNGAVYTEPANVRLTAAVTVPSGSSVSRVQFFDGTSLLATVTTSPYTTVAEELGSGQHVFTATATLTSGATARSAPVTITVTSGSFSGTASGTTSADVAADL